MSENIIRVDQNHIAIPGDGCTAIFVSQLLISLFKSTSRLEPENAALRHQPVVPQRKVRGRIEFANGDRLFLILLYRWFPSILKAMTIVRPDTVIRWRRLSLTAAQSTIAKYMANRSIRPELGDLPA